MRIGVKYDDGGTAGKEGDLLAGSRIIGAFVSGTAEDEVVGSAVGKGVNVPGFAVIAPEVLLERGAAGAIAIPFPNPGAVVHVVPAGDEIVAMVGELEFGGLTGGGGSAGGHFGEVVVPVVAVDACQRSHAFGAGHRSAGSDGSGDVGGVVDAGGAIE